MTRFSPGLAVLLAAFASPAPAQTPPALYASNLGTNAVVRIAPGGGSGSVTTFATGFNQPYGLTFDSAGVMYVANAGNGTVSKVDAAGTVTPFASGLGTPRGLAFDRAGTLYVADVVGGAIHKVDANGTVTPFAAGLSLPTGLAFDSAGTLYVSGGGNSGSISKVAPNGAVSSFVPSGLNFPAGLTFDPSGNLYVATSIAVAKVTPDGTVSQYASFSPGFGYGLAFDGSGDLFISRKDGAGAMYEYPPGGPLTQYAVNGLVSPTFIAFAPVPEPTGVLLGCAAAGSLVGIARRWRRRPVL